MNLLDSVSLIMSKDVVTLSPTDSISDAGNLFRENKIHHIPVTQNGALLGMVSKSDFLFFKRGFIHDKENLKIEEIRLRNYEVSHIMTKNIAAMESSERINVALEIFKENIFHAIPIIDDGELVGILTTYDIIKTLADDMVATNEYNLNTK